MRGGGKEILQFPHIDALELTRGILLGEGVFGQVCADSPSPPLTLQLSIPHENDLRQFANCALHILKRALYIAKRDLHIAIKALYIFQNM